MPTIATDRPSEKLHLLVESADNLIEQFNIDSIAALELLVRIEQEFHIQIPDEELSVNLINSFHGLVVYIERKCNKN
ncbi:acyl carrier protein [Photorhabdus australis subsp. thailandensis]|uniref:Acyl carrier protein n=1 Tax=Photorhabdus australis subsp. thailandensis TaxID=2805096 RepID=A0A1C0U6K0_9GAMM|nr:acyl carrier protein [Photorhabdus australis]OCQ53513.1 acyl carrier protein [Photorhabdus australis subsp. thailandensis]